MLTLCMPSYPYTSNVPWYAPNKPHPQGAHAWVLPIAHCPLDHMLNPAELKPRRSK